MTKMRQRYMLALNYLNQCNLFSTAKRKLLVSCICMFILLYYITHYQIPSNNSTSTPKSIKKEDDIDIIACHYSTEEDALPSAEDASFSPPEDSIFFHETSCRGLLNSRQACSIESAARAHPGRMVYVLFSGPVTETLLYFTHSSLFELRSYPNIQFARVHIDKYAKGTALEKIVAKRTLNASKWKIVHTSDILRFITMYKFGGLYLDTDVIVVKPFDSLGRNWLARESGSSCNGAVVNVGKDRLGRVFVRLVLEEIGTSYRPELWSHNGPGALNRVLSKFCNTTKIREFSGATCHGFNVYNPELIYPIPYPSYKKLLQPGDLQNVSQAYSFHLWNKLSQDDEVHPDSPFDKLAKQHCPRIRELYGDSFGY